MAPRAATQTWDRIIKSPQFYLATLSTYPLDHGETHFSDLDHGSQQPDVGDGGKSEDDGPDDGEGQHEESREDPVEPQLGLTEQEPAAMQRWDQH